MARILLIEDNEFNRDMLSRRLMRHGYDMKLAADGQEGLQVAYDSAPDVILLDLGLPDIDGWTVLRHLKEHPKLKRIPVMALTAHALTAYRDRALQAGFDDYDTKPVDMPRLLKKIEDLLQRGATA